MVKATQQITKKEIEQLLKNQTAVILGAVDEKIIDLKIYMERRLEKMEERFDKKINKLMDTLDQFLKRMTDVETEFTMMRADLDRVKKVIREKLGVDLA